MSLFSSNILFNRIFAILRTRQILRSHTLHTNHANTTPDPNSSTNSTTPANVRKLSTHPF